MGADRCIPTGGAVESGREPWRPAGPAAAVDHSPGDRPGLPDDAADPGVGPLSHLRLDLLRQGPRGGRSNGAFGCGPGPPRGAATDAGRTRPAPRRAVARTRPGFSGSGRYLSVTGRPGDPAGTLETEGASGVDHDRELAGTLARTGRSSRSSHPSVPRRIRSGGPKGHEGLVRIDGTCGCSEEVATEFGDVPRRAWNRAVRPAGGAPPRPGDTGAASIPA